MNESVEHLKTQTHNMIEFSRSFKTSDGNLFGLLALAQEHELNLILGDHDPEADLSSLILKHAEKIVDILTTTASSRPKARAVHGGRKPRKGKEQPALAL